MLCVNTWIIQRPKKMAQESGIKFETLFGVTCKINNNHNETLICIALCIARVF